jgi:glyoxylase-like metal-dependent hydrolase (beta-lactamase superfamily II)
MLLPQSVHVFPQRVEPDEDTTVTINPGAVETERGLLLVDTGFPGEFDQVEANLADAGFDVEDVWGVVLTHQDVDHAGGLAGVVERADPVVFAHPECAPYVDGREHPVKLDDEDPRYPAGRVDVEVTEGTQIHTAAGPLEVVFTPGHAPGHVSLYLPAEGVLFSGDALHAPEGDLDGPRFPMDEDEAWSSIERLADLDFDQTITQHGGHVEEGTAAVEAALDSRGE